ncbi:hypothetical protein [Hydrogenovibrio sp. JE_KL2]|uniref:hypothetical protein n=1 Tax=Hydrogenovibrio sp. JE_KL2 TaxID=2651188 RepID=UPI00128DD4C6|nr:hypothetical protein [Hydrogenovibrio sp. JE_KL2]MPQ75761.1 hypothetical protein [Hydrogenovibrio sp. JE_KL2]
MFCLFRNSKILYPLNLWVWLASMAPVVYWLYFAFVEKSFLQNFLSGQSLFIDLLLGLPIVLIFGIVIYAMIYWLLKFIVIMFWPQMIEKLDNTSEEDQMPDPSLGENYWMEAHDEEPHSDKHDSRKHDSDKPHS